MVLPMFSFDSQAISFVSEELKQLEKEQLPFATSYAINTVARKVRDAEKEEIKRVFDEPTRWTVNSIFINPSSKNDLEAVVWLKDWAPKGTPAADYLQPHIQGGPRQLKRYEKALKRKGMLKAGEYTVPANTFKKNRYGNISQGQYTKMLSNVGAQNDIWQNSRDSKKIQYFVRRDGAPMDGIWRKQGNKLEPFLLFTNKAPTYRAIYNFEAVANRTIATEMPEAFRLAMEKAMESAR